MNKNIFQKFSVTLGTAGALSHALICSQFTWTVTMWKIHQSVRYTTGLTVTYFEPHIQMAIFLFISYLLLGYCMPSDTSLCFSPLASSEYLWLHTFTFHIDSKPSHLHIGLTYKTGENKKNLIGLILCYYMQFIMLITNKS